MKAPAGGTCQLGDLTVTPSHGLYLISRVLARPGYGPWWEFVANESQRDAAFQRARILARTSNAKVWAYEAGDFQDITDEQTGG